MSRYGGSISFIFLICILLKTLQTALPCLRVKKKVEKKTLDAIRHAFHSSTDISVW